MYIQIGELLLMEGDNESIFFLMNLEKHWSGKTGY